MEINRVIKRILEFQRTPRKISRRALRQVTLNWNQPFKIWGTTKDGERYEGRELFSFTGPSNSPLSPLSRYNYPSKGYMIFYDMRKGAPRTFIYANIDAFEQDGIYYEVI